MSSRASVQVSVGLKGLWSWEFYQGATGGLVCRELWPSLGPWSPAFYKSSLLCKRPWLPWAHGPQHSTRLAESAKCTGNYGPLKGKYQRCAHWDEPQFSCHPPKVQSLYKMIPGFFCQNVASPLPHMSSWYGAWHNFTFIDMLFCHQSNHSSHYKC